MSAFGHQARNIGFTHIDTWGAGTLLLRYGGREWWFDFSEMFGPLLLRKTDHQQKVNQPDDPDHPFWEAFNAWTDSGRKHRPVRAGRSKITGKQGPIKFHLCHVKRAK